MVGPLICHFFIEKLKGDHKDKAGIFCRNHLSSIEKDNYSPIVRELINLFISDGDIKETKELFRSKLTVIELNPESQDMLKNIVPDNCHVVFLQVKY